MQFFFQTGAFNQGSGQPGLVNQLQTSVLVPYFNRVLWLLVRSLSFFVIGQEGPNILETVVNNAFTVDEESFLWDAVYWLG